MLNRGLTGIDIFSGAGGMSEGFEAAGIRMAVAIEKHPHAALTYSFNHPGSAVFCGDIGAIESETILQKVKQQTGSDKIDVLAGGPPCQGFSPAGKQNQRDPRNRLIYEFVRIVSEIQPTCFVFENVPAITDVSKGKVVQSLLDKFWALDYQIHGIDNHSEFYPSTFPIYDSSWFGVPQKRKRLILVGWRNHFQDFNWITSSSSHSCKEINIENAISDLDFLESGYECHSYQNEPKSNYQKSRRANTDFVFNHLASNHRDQTIKMFEQFLPGDTVSSIPAEYRTGKQRVRRFTRTSLSPAILALPDDYIHYKQNRIPTVRELARLQSFDDDYVFFGKRTTSDKNRRVDVPQYTQVGNAVPPLMARSLGRAIIKAFGENCKDIRHRAMRRKRLSEIIGSSSFSGYELSEKLGNSLDLFDANNNRIYLDHPVSSIKAVENDSPTRWSGTSGKVA